MLGLHFANVNMQGVNMLRVWIRQDLRRGRAKRMTRRNLRWARQWGMRP